MPSEKLEKARKHGGFNVKKRLDIFSKQPLYIASIEFYRKFLIKQTSKLMTIIKNIIFLLASIGLKNEKQLKPWIDNTHQRTWIFSTFLFCFRSFLFP